MICSRPEAEHENRIIMKKKILTMLLAAMTATAALAGDRSAWYGDTYSKSLTVVDKKIYIKSADDLAALHALWDKYKDGDKGYKGYTIYLETDIDLAYYNFINWTIGWSSDRMFAGNFDGQGHTIDRLRIEGKSGNRGLFGYINNARIENLKLTNAWIQCGEDDAHVGALCGRMANRSTISHCAVVSGTVQGYDTQNDDEIGSICGYMTDEHNDILYCYSNANVKGEREIGGIVGKTADGNTCSIRHCYYTGKIACSDEKYYGAIAGQRDNQPLENNFYLYNDDETKGIGSPSGCFDATAGEIKRCLETELQVPLLFGAADTEYVYLPNSYPELKVFLRYKPGLTFYEKNIGNMNGTDVPGYLKVVNCEESPYTMELAKIMPTSGSDFTLNGDFTTYFSGQPLRMVSLPANSFQNMGSLNTVTLPATLTSIGVPQRHSVQNAFNVYGEGSGFAVKDGALYDMVNKRLMTAPKSLSTLTIHQQYANSIADYAFENMTSLRKLYVDTYVPAGTPVDDDTNKAPLITLDNNNIFNGTPSDLNVYIKDGTANRLFIGRQGPGAKTYGYANADIWGEKFYFEYEDKPNRMFSYFPVKRNPGGMSTLIMGYPVELPEGVTAWWARGLSDGNVHLRQLGTQIVPALTPVLLTYEGTSDLLYLTRYEGGGAGAATDYENNLLKGSVDPGGHTMTSSELTSNFFTLGRPTGDSSYDNLGFYQYHPTNNILPSYVAWLAASDIPSEARFFMEFSNDETTAIGALTPLLTDKTQVFTLQGVRINPSAMQKGQLYIVNGKKVMMK